MAVTQLRFAILGASFVLHFMLYAQDSKPNILWITCEDISPAWGCYGDEQAWTPNIDKLAAESYIFTQAFSNAPICAPARSTLISGKYATSLGTQHLRSEIPVPQSFQILPEILSRNGYYTSNNAKTDYNFSPEGRWEANSSKAHWRNRKKNQPFFSVFNYGITHEGHANSDVQEDTESLPEKHHPDEISLPPYFPDTEEFRKIMSHQYDLISVFDQEVGDLLGQLEEDGLMDETIIFLFSDHGFGLPRYKRWLYDSGIRVPFVMYIPKKYKSLSENWEVGEIPDLVAFVDFAPTVLGMAGIEIPIDMEGRNFLASGFPKEYVFGYRDRADDVLEMSRSVYDGHYLYIRHFLPHKPYIQNAIIFNRGKRSYDELFRIEKEGKLPPPSQKMFENKGAEELYDLQNDPNELNNLIDIEKYRVILNKLREKLEVHIIKTSDTGLMNEAEMISKATGSSVYEMAHNAEIFNPEKVLEAAMKVGFVKNPEELQANISDPDPFVRYWAIMAMDAYQGDMAIFRSLLEKKLSDPSFANRVLAAEILVRNFNDAQALEVLKQALKNSSNVNLLYAAISVRNIGEKAGPLKDFIVKDIYPEISGDIWGRYRSWSYPMFIGMALDQTRMNCGENIEFR